MKKKKIIPPKPTEETLTTLITRLISLPNGREMRLSMSKWHWDMVEFIEIWNDHYGREHGFLYEFHKRAPNITDAAFANATMKVLRDDYNDWLDGTPEGKEPEFTDPCG